MTEPHEAESEAEVNERWALPFSGEPRLEFESELCAVTLVPTEPGEAPYAETQGGLRMALDVTRTGDTVRVRARPSSISPLSWWVWGRRSRLVLRVPAAVHATVLVASGSIRARGLHGGELRASTDAGTIHVDDVSGYLWLLAIAGKIEGRRLSGRFDVESNAGAIRLGIVGLAPGQHSVRTDVGAILLDLAPGLRVRVSASSELGAVRLDYPSSDEAPVRLDVSTNLGAVQVRALPGVVAAGPPPRVPEGGPYREPAGEAARAAELERVLQLVAEGKLSAPDAGELLRAIGYR